MVQFMGCLTLFFLGWYIAFGLNPGILAVTLIWVSFLAFPLLARSTWRNLDRGTTIYENGVMTFFVAGMLVYRTFIPFGEIRRTERVGRTLRLVSWDGITWCEVNLDELGDEGESVLSDMLAGRDWRVPIGPKLVVYSAHDVLSRERYPTDKRDPHSDAP
jgi:hypothetical protein